MDASARIRTTRQLLVAAIVFGLVLGGVSLFVGAGIPGIIAGAAGWSLVIAGIVWIVVSYRQRTAASTRPGSWRPGDEDVTP